MFWIFVRIASVRRFYPGHMLLEGLMQYSYIISQYLSSLDGRFRHIQIIIITNFVVVSSVGIKRVDCTYLRCVQQCERTPSAQLHAFSERKLLLKQAITKTCLYNFDPLKPHFYIVKLGFTGVYIIFLISALKLRLWVLVRTASLRRF